MKKYLSLYLLFVTMATKIQAQTVTDYDGNNYETVQIGTQLWMKQNLRATHYSDGTLISNSCLYNNNLTDSIYGLLYNWDAAMKNNSTEKSQGACPTGWHVPSDNEWLSLFNYISDSTNCASALKDTNTSFWDAPLVATNITGFSMVGGGHGYNCTNFYLQGTHAEFWTSSQINSSKARNWSANNQSAGMFRHYNQDKQNNFSVRCIQDNKMGIIDTNSVSSVSIYPNPSEGIIYIESKIGKLENCQYEIYNSLGELVKSANLMSEKEAIILESISGIYFYKIYSNDLILKSGKFILR